MLNTYYEIVTHPMFYVIIALTALIYGVQWATSLPKPKLRLNHSWLRQNYVWLILSAVGGLFVCAMLFYLVEVAWSLRGVVDRLGYSLKTPEADTGDLRNLAYAIGALIAVLAGSATIFFSSIRVWINERTTTATEQGLITDRINKAVEGLGAEKEVNFLGRPVTIWTGTPRDGNRSYLNEKDIVLPDRAIELSRSNGTDFFYDPEKDDHVERQCGWVKFRTWPEEYTDIERKGVSLSLLGTDHLAERGAWKVFTATEPNIEVRIGSILALERLAKQNLDFHIQIMEILCAYVRENAQIGQENPPDKPRSDIQMAMTVLGRRSPSQIEIERSSESPGTDLGYRMVLRNCQLDGADLTGLDFSHSRLEYSSLRSCLATYSKFTLATLHNTDLSKGDFSSCDLGGAKFNGSKLESTLLFRSDAGEAIFSSCKFLRTTLFFENAQRVLYSECDLSQSIVKQSDISNAFGNGSVLMRPIMDRPTYWPSTVLDLLDLLTEYDKWLTDPENYAPTDKTD